MSKITLNDTSGGYNLQVINDNFQKIEDELNTKVLYRNNPVGEPNSLETDLDANSKRIFNLPEPTSPSEAARLHDIRNAISGGAANLIGFTPTGDISSTNVQSAIVEVNTFLQSETGAVNRFVTDKLKEIISVKDFGAVGDGIVDDTASLQLALDSNKLCFVPPGKYRITSNLLIDPIRNRNCGFIGLTQVSRYPSTQQIGGPTWNGTKECVIFYDGVINASAAVIAASAEAVGVEPSSTFDNTVWGVTLNNITLDANNKAGYGWYGARVQDMQFDHVRARGATVTGISINGTYSGRLSSIRCYLNPGRGFELGAADDRWGWTTNDKVNALHIIDLHCDANGSDSTFRESDPLLKKSNCGVYFGPHRGVTIFGVTSENNFGANIVFEPTSSGNAIHGFYTELGCKFAPGGAGTDAISLGYATQQWGIIFIGTSAATHNVVSDGVCATDRVWMTGSEPTSARDEGAFEIRNISLSGGTHADWANYRLINCALESENIIGTSPKGSLKVIGRIESSLGGATHASGAFNASTGSIVLNGTPKNCTISYAGVGLYDVTILDDMANTQYTVICPPAAANRGVAITSKAIGSFRISHFTTSTGAVTDASADLAFAVIGTPA